MLNVNAKSKYAFNFSGPEDLIKETESKGYNIPLKPVAKESVDLFKVPVRIKSGTIPNRFCSHPMEGCDGLSDGNPGELTYRKYERLAKGGSGLIWIEATAVVAEGRATPRQLWINENSVPGFKKLLELIKNSSVNEKGNRINPYVVLQLTHSGRYSKPEGTPKPMIMHHSPILDPHSKLPEDYPLVTDEYLDKLQDKFVGAAKLAYECGYDAVDVKACHGYLLHEMLSAFTRTGSKYAGSYENRTRFMKEVIKRIKEEVPGIGITTRLNVYDAYPYPYGFGMKQDGSMDYDLTEPKKLIAELKELGVDMVNICVGNPYFNPHVERPYDFPLHGAEVPDIEPLELIERVVKITDEIAKSAPDVTIVATGFSWLRHLSINAGLAMIENGQCHIFGVGRLALAHPGYANEFFEKGGLTPNRCCITCSCCSQMMRDGGMSGCVIRDAKVYKPIYREGRERAMKNREQHGKKH